MHIFEKGHVSLEADLGGSFAHIFGPNLPTPNNNGAEYLNLLFAALALLQ